VKKLLAIGSVHTIPDTDIRVRTTLEVSNGVIWNHFESLTPEDPEEDYNELLWGE